MVYIKFKYDHKKFTDIRKIYSYHSKPFSLNLQKIQALTGYFYWVGKMKAFKKLQGQQDFCFLGSYSQTILSNGNKK